MVSFFTLVSTFRDDGGIVAVSITGCGLFTLLQQVAWNHYYFGFVLKKLP